MRTMNTTVGFSLIRMFKNCTALIKEKDIGFIRASSDDEDDQDDDFITPYTYQDFRTQVYSPQQNAPVEACVPICEPFPKKSEKYQPQNIRGLNQRFQRKCALNKESDFASFGNPVPMRTIRTMS